MRPQQPMPATTTTFSESSSRERMASTMARSTMPLEQPGHQIVFGEVRWLRDLLGGVQGDDGQLVVLWAAAAAGLHRPGL